MAGSGLVLARSKFINPGDKVSINTSHPYTRWLSSAYVSGKVLRGQILASSGNPTMPTPYGMALCNGAYIVINNYMEPTYYNGVYTNRIAHLIIFKKGNTSSSGCLVNNQSTGASPRGSGTPVYGSETHGWSIGFGSTSFTTNGNKLLFRDNSLNQYRDPNYSIPNVAGNDIGQTHVVYVEHNNTGGAYSTTFHTAYFNQSRVGTSSLIGGDIWPYSPTCTILGMFYTGNATLGANDGIVACFTWTQHNYYNNSTPSFFNDGEINHMLKDPYCFLRY